MKALPAETSSSPELQKTKMIISMFINSCSHTMRGPLKSIEGLVNLLHLNGQNYSKDESKMFLDLIKQTAIKLESTLDELENLLENSQQVVIKKQADFDKLIRGAIQPHKGEIEDAGILVETHLEEKVPLYTDISRLRIILSHVITNAIHFRDDTKTKREVHLSIKTTEDACTIAVSDNGIGIDSANHDKIFDLFLRASEKSRGAGAGLYVVKDMITKMNGTVTLDSIPAIGSVFTIRLPNMM